jgi:hypothetical protein
VIASKYEAPEGLEQVENPTIFVRMNEAAALSTIHSLSAQLLAGNPNTGRHEVYAESGSLFTISVVPDEAIDALVEAGHRGE